MSHPLVLAWADDLFLHGHQYAAWTTDYVDLEESLAMGSISQENLAHAAALLGACGLTAAERDERIYVRDGEHWFPSALSFIPLRDWSATVARGFLLSRGVLVLSRHLALPDRPRLQQLAEVIRAEQEVHARHWERWVHILGTSPVLRPAFADHLGRAAGDADDLFGSPPGVDEPDDMVTDEPGSLQRAWASETSEVLATLGVEPPELPSVPVDRRSGRGSSALDTVLADLRFARGPDGAPRYEVYR